MDEFEIAYYLDGQQLLLLLSLIDQKPVVGLPRIEEPENWQSVSLSLLQSGWLRYEADQLRMNKELSELLLIMKAADKILAAYLKASAFTSRIFCAGDQLVSLEFLPNKKYRLRQEKKSELRRRVESLLMSSSPMPETLLDTLSDDVFLRPCLDYWEGQPLSLEDVVALWLQFDEVRGVLECQTLKEKIRWIWIKDRIADVVLRQDLAETRAVLDTVSQQKLLLRELGLEG